MTTKQEARMILDSNGFEHIEIIEFQAQSRPGTFVCHKCEKTFTRKTCGDVLKKGCPHCDYKTPSNILSIDDVQRKISSVHPNMEIVSYTRTDKQIIIRCLDCGHEWEVSELDVAMRESHQCPRCAEQQRINKNIADIRATLDKHDLANIAIVNATLQSEEITLQCSSCGTVFHLRDLRHVKTFRGCPTCNSIEPLMNDEISRQISLLNKGLHFKGRNGYRVSLFCDHCQKETSAPLLHPKDIDEIECSYCKRVQADTASIMKKIDNSNDPIELVTFDEEHRMATLQCNRCDTKWDVQVNTTPYFKCPTCSQKRKQGDFHRITKAEYERRLKAAEHDNVEVVDFHGMTKPATLKCLDCGEVWTVSEAKHKIIRCPACKRKQKLDTQREDLQKFLDQANKQIQVISYEGSKKPVELLCKRCGHTWALSNERNARNTKGCPKCLHGDQFENALTHAALIKPFTEVQVQLKERFPNIEILSYNGQSHPAHFRCNKCGHEWEEKEARTITNGVKTGCPQCVKAERKQALLDKWTDIVNDKYDNVQVIDIKCENADDIKLRCEVCGHEWIVPQRKTLIDTPSRFHTNICNECYPRRKSSHPMDERTYRRILDEKMHGMVELVEFRGYHNKSLFRCPYGHTWEALSEQVTLRKTGCPHCNQHESLPEETLFYYFKKLLDVEVYCNAKLRLPDGNNYNVDIFVPSHNLIIEYDGFRWHETPYTIEHDKEREREFGKYGINIIHLREVRRRKGRKRFYNVQPYWIDTSQYGQKGRNNQISHAIQAILSDIFDIDDADVDMNRDKGAIRAYWHSDMVTKSEFSVTIKSGGLPHFDKLIDI